MTPIRPFLVAATARRVAGRITSTTGTSYRSRASRSIAALAELQAMTSALTPWCDQVVEALERVLADLTDRLGTVGLAGGVADVQQRLVRELVDHRPGDGETPEPGVEDADRCVQQLGVAGVQRWHD